MAPLDRVHIAETPRGLFRSRVDGEGRLALPPRFREFLSAMGEQRVFATSFDEQVARIYPVSVWLAEVQPVLEQSGDCAQTCEDLCFTANRLGCDSRIDRKGRVHLSSELRQTLGLDSQDVYVEHQRGHFKVFTDSVYRQRRDRSRQDADRKLRDLERHGLR